MDHRRIRRRRPTFAEVCAAVETEADRLFHLDGGRDGADEVRTPQQQGVTGPTAGPPAVRNQMLFVARDGGCIACGANPSRCEAHHVMWRRNDGPTDIENLALVPP